MKLLSVGLTGTIEEVRTKLQHGCKSLIHEGFRIAIEETQKGGYTFLGCNIVEGELSFRNYERLKGLLKKSVAQTLADQIVGHEEKKIIRRIITRHFNYFDEAEQEIIYKNTLKLLDTESVLPIDYRPSERYSQVLNKIIDYLDINHEFVVEGFINFRLKDYKQQLTAIVEKAVDEFMMDLEYREFIKILRHFVEIQDSRIDEAHVIIMSSECYRIVDSYGKVLNSQYLESCISKNANDINYEDLLISALIGIAPQNVVIHTAVSGNYDAVETIRRVFEGRVVLCEGCEVCRAQPVNEYQPT